VNAVDVHGFNVVVVVSLEVRQVGTEVLLVGAVRGRASGGGGTTGKGRFRPARKRGTNQVNGENDGEQYTGPVHVHSR